MTKSVTVATPVERGDPEPTFAPGTHQESKPQIVPPPDTNLPQQHSVSIKEAAKTDEHPVAPAAHSASSDKPSQAPPSNSSSHGGKHDDSNLAQSSSPEVKAPQQSNGNPTDARTTFSDTMASKVLGAIPSKDSEGVAVPSTTASQSAEVARTQSSKTDADYPDQPSAVAAPLGTIHSAKLVAQAAQSELRVGFHAGEFGNVDIRTSMIRSQLTAEISVEHGELRNLLAVELPHLQTKLAGHSFTTANIALSTHTGGSSSNSKQAYQQNGQGSQSADPRLAEQSMSGVTALEESQPSTTQLDVHI